MAKILLELFDDEPLNNIISFFDDRYDGVIYFSFASEAPDSRKKHILSVFLERNFHISPVFATIQEYSLYSVQSSFERNLQPNNDYFFDITGGSELFLLAVGTYFQKMPQTTIRQYDIRTGKRILQIPENQSSEPLEIPLPFRDIIELNGGKVLSVSDGISYDYSDESLRHRIHQLWEAVKHIPNEWNRFCSLPYSESSDPAITVRRLTKSTDAVQTQRVLTVLKNAGIVTFGQVLGNQVQYAVHSNWKDHPLLKKSGFILEMYSCLAAYDCGIFDDCHCGTIFDFDGILSNRPGDPKNELDVTMMYRKLPVFVSCKNTQATKEHLYEIKTMTRHFGGRDAIAVLLSSQICLSSTIERAEQTDVILIDNIAGLSYPEFKDRLMKIADAKHGHC